jgi:TyrR family helix-turn-helix protein
VHGQKAVALSEDDLLDDLIEKEIGAPEGSPDRLQVCFEHDGDGFEEQVAGFEKEILITTMKQHDTTRALASHLKMSQSAVVRRLKKHGLSKQLRRKKGRP